MEESPHDMSKGKPAGSSLRELPEVALAMPEDVLCVAGSLVRMAAGKQSLGLGTALLIKSRISSCCDRRLCT